MVRHWNRLLEEVVNAPPPEVLKARLDKALSKLVYGEVILLVNSFPCGLINLYLFTEIKILFTKRKLGGEILALYFFYYSYPFKK